MVLLARITVNPEIFGGKPIIRGRRIAPLVGDPQSFAAMISAMADRS